MMGYRIVIGVLTVVLVAVSVLYYSIHKQQQDEYALLDAERTTLEANLKALNSDYNKLKSENAQLSLNLESERLRVDSLTSALQQERSLNYAKLRKYERELSSLRAVMKDYQAQIDSLNKLNRELIDQNVVYKKKVASSELRAEQAETEAKKLNSQVELGSKLVAQQIEITAVNSKGREQSRVKKAAKLSVDFALAANKLAKKGNVTIYTQVTSPDGYVISTQSLPSINVKGEKVTYSASRKVDYNNEALNVSIFVDGEGFEAGLYKVKIYTDSDLIGSSEVTML
ncbi:MAG: hypothetical protein SNG35_07230 [Rikenellaceae bacterium]